MNSYQNYVVCFSDGRIKIGMTSDFQKRMSYYRQQAQKSGVQQVTWWAATAFVEKHASLLMERLLCTSYGHLAAAGSREWFRGDAALFAAIIKQSEFVRELLAGKTVEKEESFGYWSKSGQVGVLA